MQGDGTTAGLSVSDKLNGAAVSVAITVEIPISRGTPAGSVDLLLAKQTDFKRLSAGSTFGALHSDPNANVHFVELCQSLHGCYLDFIIRAIPDSCAANSRV